MTVCPQCGYERTKNDDSFVSAEECPKCGVFYNKLKPSAVFKSVAPVIVTNNIKQENNILTRPRGVNITARLLIVICGIQIAGFLFVMVKTGSGIGLIIIPVLLVGSMSPAIGLVSGIGLLSKKQWALNYVLSFSKISIALYGLGVATGILFEPLVIWSNVIFVIVYGCSLPFWCLYYFTRPHIKDSLMPK